MSTLIQSISKTVTSEDLQIAKVNVDAMVAQECSHLNMIAFVQE
jgi:hypothetical protein